MAPIDSCRQVLKRASVFWVRSVDAACTAVRHIIKLTLVYDAPHDVYVVAFSHARSHCILTNLLDRFLDQHFSITAQLLSDPYI